jgi:hypothetical protein
MLELVPSGRDLETITQDIHAQREQAQRMVLEQAVSIGLLLQEARPLFTGDEQGYLAWALDEFDYRRAHVFRLLKLGQEVSRVRLLPPDTSMRQALAALMPASAESEPKPLPEAIEVKPKPLLRFCQDLPTATIVTLILHVAFPDAKTALDMTYGSGAFWDGSAHVEVTAHDNNPARALDGVVDFTKLPYGKNDFDVALFDPPHIADAGAESIMGQRFGTYSEEQLPDVIRAGAREAWRVARLGIIVKITDHIHGLAYVLESDWVRDALDGQPPYDVVHQVRSGAMVDPKWEEQLSAYNNGSSYLIFRRGVQKHVRRRAR